MGLTVYVLLLFMINDKVFKAKEALNFMCQEKLDSYLNLQRQLVPGIVIALILPGEIITVAV